jgi:hypothetical protein
MSSEGEEQNSVHAQAQTPKAAQSKQYSKGFGNM